MGSDTKSDLIRLAGIGGLLAVVFGSVSVAQSVLDKEQGSPECQAALKKLEPVYQQLTDQVKDAKKLSVLVTMKVGEKGNSCVFHKY